MTICLQVLYTQSMKTDPAPERDFPVVLLVYLITLFSSLRLIATNWTSGLYSTLFLVILGTSLGLTLGASRFRPLVANLLGLAYSLVFIPWTLADIFYEQIPWIDRLINISGRLSNSLDLFFQKKPVEDTLLFITFLAVIYFLFSLLAGFQWMRNGNITWVLIPVWILLVTIQIYDNALNNRAIYLIFCMFFSLLLIGRKFLVFKRRYWRENRVHSTAESKQDMTMFLLIFSAALILLTWAIPVNKHQVSIIKTAWEKITEPWRSARQDLGNAIAGLNSSSSRQSTDLYGGDILQLGHGAINGEAALFKVQVPTNSLSSRSYWRVRSYDLYQNDEWSNSPHNDQIFEPYMASLRLPDSSMSATSEFTFSIIQGRLINLPTPAQAVWISRPVISSIFKLDYGMVDPILLKADIAIHAGESYQVQAIESNPTILDLRRAGQDYPDWVLEHYLQRPGNLSKRVKDLAEQLTAGLSNPLDKVNAITHYLRTAIAYKTEISNPPFGANTLEWFLLDNKEGYCNYYATAEVILLRQVGIPARLVVGFAQGEVEPGQQDTFIIQQKDAHAWPEAYFRGIGWVEFEPTSARSDILRPTGLTPTEAGGTPGITVTESASEQGTGQPLTSSSRPGSNNQPPYENDLNVPTSMYLLFGVILFGLVAILLGRNLKRRHLTPTPIAIRLKNALEKNSIQVPLWLNRLADRAGEAPIQRAFNEIFRSVKRLGKPAQPAETPQDVCAVLMGSLPSAANEISSLLEEYLKFMYSRHAPDDEIANRASMIIRKQTDLAVFQRRIDLIKRLFHPHRQ